jgi:hypothetical protein
VVGAAKAGTTSVYNYLKEHPQVFMSAVKEPKYFALEGMKLDYGGPGDSDEMHRHSITDLGQYEALFESANGETAIGEASTLYLYSDVAAERMYAYNPDLKIVAFLRNPIERAYSNFTYMVRRGREPLRDFEAALEAEPQRIAHNWMPGWHYTARGFYSAQVARFLSRFKADQCRIYLYDDLQRDTAAVMRDLYGFLGVDSSFVPDTGRRHNASGMPRSETLHRLLVHSGPLKSIGRQLLPGAVRRSLRRMALARNLERSAMPDTTRGRLREMYRPDILNLQGLINRDLTSWLQ